MGIKVEIIKDIARQFVIKGEILSVEPFGAGHVNKTFLVCTDKKKYVLQKINTVAFKKPKELMENIINVTVSLASRGIETMTFIPTREGAHYFKGDDYYRMYVFVDDVVVYQEIPNKEVFKKAGFAFGEFINHLKNFDCKELHETIKDFHNTPKRFNDFKCSVEKDSVDRVKDCKEEIDFILEREQTLGLAVEQLKNGTLPTRVTHNDTKLNNILIEEKTLQPRMVIDLDTVMPGSLIYDFGDAIRFGASTANEDEKDLSKVHFDMQMFSAFAEGFCAPLKNTMTDKEWELLPYGAYLMTIECGMRFLSDYLDGDVYFSTAYDNHNLVRARTQLKLAKEMQENLDKMGEFINQLKNR